MKHVLLLSVVIVCVGSCTESGAACDETSARLVARSYVLTMPLLGRDDEMIPLMQANREHFTESGGAIQCMRSLGSYLMESGMRQFQQYSGDSASETFGGRMPPGLEHLPGQVDQSMRSYGSDMFSMGEELTWLSSVLPAAAKGDYSLYNAAGTTTRQAIMQVLPIYQMLCQMDPGICQMMYSEINNMTVQIEQQVYSLAMAIR